MNELPPASMDDTAAPAPEALDRQVGGEHYKNLAIQPVEYIQRNELGWCEGNVIKLVTRHRLKNRRQDIEKAIHYLQILLELEYPPQGSSDGTNRGN